ncbi:MULTISPECIES: flagellar filament capping protein FliD [unclassified Paenibacillus]|uniref:flagellar filament capping protein FliD n=2 Tax=Paenibacillus TaxID=44249 RepID=UPI0024074442|nr:MULTISPECIES: flagellar filament capping protein FliD [unclassified Paenibacillus]MDF9852926.1 flagellar hook-associated protein 2 [Paenibacillus sp. PastF-1]MDF9840143.1 flagellar hook-associated protein 2 [Paenibacillus sp. PastF-2]MDF9846725.1 flagellar hook-associated protein 2 [Paenibacillus sp. PastM-2]MDH6478569.1 flagellar hook-associated protein 2 [Paenibacillus sp. PastH-2]MDH6505933.1 flagellar hook-associated protein 2 [Paenibacillus sp. PastM-3]
MVIRVNGFSSGMDIDSIVKELMTAKRQPLVKLNQSKTLLEWQRDSYRDINSKLVDFKMNKLSEWNKSAQMNTQQAVVTGNTSAVKADATANANGVEMTVNVTKLATRASAESSSLVSTSTSKTATTSTLLSDIQHSGTVALPSKITINNVDIAITSTDTISSLMGRINSSDAKVKASFDEVSGKLTLTSTEDGDKTYLAANEIDSSLKSLLNLNTFNNAQKAQLTIKSSKSGTEVPYESITNSLMVNGVSLTFLAVSGTGGASTISTTPSTDKTVETIKSFVDTYNSLITTMSTKVGEEKYRNFPPLTDEQKSQMKEADITNWEAKAKSGLLKNDSILQTVISDLRSVISKNLGSLSDMGITTGQYYEGGKIYLDEAKLKQALTANPQRVTELFQGNSASIDGGIFGQMSKLVDKSLDNIVTKAGTSKFTTDLTATYKTESVMGRMLKDYNSRIDAMTDRLTDLETRYYKQFTAMETAMSKYNSQSSSLSSYL